MSEKRGEKAVLREKEKYVDVPDVIVLYFQRADNPKRIVSIKTTPNDLMERVVTIAAHKLGIKSGRIGVTGGGEPISLIGKTVGDILREYNTVSFQISSADMLG